MAIPQEYLDLLEQYNTMYDKRRALADSQALGEAQRRGLVGQTGTSSIESLMRSRAVSPVEEARAAAVADIMKQSADKNREERLIQEGRAYGTSEREATQKYGTGEREASQTYQSGQSEAQRAYEKAMNEYLQQQQMEQQKQRQDYDKQSLIMQRGWQGSDIKKERQDWWKDALGSAVGGVASIFCFDAETLVDMADGSRKAIKDIEVGDSTLGGDVLSTRISKVYDGEVFNYLGVIVTSTHAVKESGEWKRIGESNFAIPVLGDRIVYSIITTKHRIYANGITFADEAEHDDLTLSFDESIKLLNEQEKVH